MVECGGLRSRDSGEELRHEPETNKTPACAVRGAVCHCLPLPASLSLIISSTIPFHPLPLSPSRRGRNLYLSQPGRVSTQQVREKQGRRRRRREAVGPPPSLIDCSCVRIQVPGFPAMVQ